MFKNFGGRTSNLIFSVTESEIGYNLHEIIYILVTESFLPLTSGIFPLCDTSVVVDKIYSTIAVCSLLLKKEKKKGKALELALSSSTN